MSVCDDRVQRVGNLISCFSWYVWYILRRLTKILLCLKSLQFTSPISRLISLSRDFSKLSISSIVWYSYFGGPYHAITIKGLVHFCFTSALLVLCLFDVHS